MGNNQLTLMKFINFILYFVTAIWSYNCHAQSSEAFKNPFADSEKTKKVQNDNFFDDNDEDDEDFLEEEPRKISSTPKPTPRSAGGLPTSQGLRPTVTPRGVVLGTPTSHQILTKNESNFLQVDDETAEGSKEVITDFNFPEAEITDIAKALGRLTGKNFILDKEIKGKITIISNSSITVGEAWKAFLTALDVNGFAIIPSGKYLRIAKQRDAREKQLRTYSGISPNTDALITRIFQLKYISAEELARTLRAFVPASSRIATYDQTNTMIVTDTGANIVKLAQMVELLDVEGYEAGIELIPVKYASAAEISKMIDTLIPGAYSSNAGGGAVGRLGLGGRLSTRRTKEGGIINTIIADDRTNTLIVHANAKGTEQIRQLVAKLDQTTPSSAGGKVHVVYLQFADAEQIANTLNTFSQSQAGGRPPSGPGGGGSNPIAGTLFEGSIKIAPDKATNALVITASHSDFITVQRVINRLDIPREQVYVEVAILEVNLGRNFNYSANLLAFPSLSGSVTNKSDILNFMTATTNPQNLDNGALIGLPIGKSTTMTIAGQTITVAGVQGLLKAIQTNSNVNVLATPQVIALDNAEAHFESAEKIPYQSSNAVQGTIATSIQKESVALSITIKPQINKITNFVKMDVTTKMGTIQNRALPKLVQDAAYATLDRTAKTTVVVGDADTVVLGGLIRDQNDETITKIPLLGDIPLLGWLFRSKTVAITKSNLLIFMTPYIIRQYEKIRSVLDKKLRERDDFIEKEIGGDDLLRSQRDHIIQSLPNLEELTKNHPKSTINIDDDAPNEDLYLDNRPAAVPVAPGVPLPQMQPPAVEQAAPTETVVQPPPPLAPPAEAKP
jgi:general secretion pathway protein D